MISALRDKTDDPEQAQAYLDKQIAHTERINQENLKLLQDQYDKKSMSLLKEINELKLENERLSKNTTDKYSEIEKEKEYALKLQEAELNHREQQLRIQLLGDEKEQLKKEVTLLHQKLKDQNEISAIKVTRLEEKIKFSETKDQEMKHISAQDLSILSVSVPSSKGFKRSQSPTVGNEAKLRQMKKEHKEVVDELKYQLKEKDDFIKGLLMEKEELIMRINELENTIQYLKEQIELIYKENETNEQLYDTKLKRMENEYMQQINLLDSEKQNAKNMLSHLQHVIKTGDSSHDPVIRKLNFSVCLNNSDSNSKLTRFHTLTNPGSPVRNHRNEESKSNHRQNQFSNNKNMVSNSKCRSRNPSAS